MELTEQSLENAIIEIWKHTRDRGEVVSMKPTLLLIQPWLYRDADRLINPWKGRRARWLATKRG